MDNKYCEVQHSLADGTTVVCGEEGDTLAFTSDSEVPIQTCIFCLITLISEEAIVSFTLSNKLNVGLEYSAI